MRDAGSEAEETEGEGGGRGTDLKEGSGEIKPERGDVGGQPAIAVTPLVQLGAHPAPPSRPQSAGAAETGLPVVLWEITLFKQMKCEHCLPYANRPRLISSLPVVQFKMSPHREGGWLGGWVLGGKDLKNVTEPQVLSVVWVACQ